MIFAIYGSWEDMVCSKILPRGVGIICPLESDILRILNFLENWMFIFWNGGCLQISTVIRVSHVRIKVLQAKWPYWPWDYFINFVKMCFWYVFYQSDFTFCRLPHFSFVFIIDVFLCKWDVSAYLLIIILSSYYFFSSYGSKCVFPHPHP